MPRNDTEDIYLMNVHPKIPSYRVYLSQSSHKNNFQKPNRNHSLYLKQGKFSARTECKAIQTAVRKPRD